MMIEWLRFLVDADRRAEFIQHDETIWTTALAQKPGFISKETWINPDDPREVIMVVRWSSMDEWKSIPPEELRQVDATFSQAMGNTSFQLVDSVAYQVYSSSTWDQGLNKM